MSPGSVSHAKKHFINSTNDHKPIPGDHDENSIVVIDVNGLPVKDSGIQISSIASGLQFVDNWDASGGLEPVPTREGQYWIISGAGTIGSVDYEIGDWLVYVDDTPTWVKIDNTESGVTMEPDFTLAGELPDISDIGFNSWIDGSRGIAIGNTTKRAFLCWLIVQPGLPPTREIQFVALDNAVWKPDISGAYPTWSAIASWEDKTKGFLVSASDGRTFLMQRFEDNLYFVELTNNGVSQHTLIKSYQVAPPLLPDEGDIYVIAKIATGIWTGKEGQFAVYVNGTWLYITPKVGWIFVDPDKNIAYCDTVGITDPATWSHIDGLCTHSALLGLNWSVSGHTIDADINLDKHRLLFSTQTKNWAMGIAENILGTPPVSPVNDGFYLVNIPVSGAFVGHAGQIAHYLTVGGWTFRTPDALETWSTKGTANLYITAGIGGWSLLWTLANHNNLQGVGADDHHAKSHAHDGVDGSGTVSYTNLSNKPIVFKADVTLAGTTPVYADISAIWSDGDRGLGIGTGGREFMIVRRGSGIKYVELS